MKPVSTSTTWGLKDFLIRDGDPRVANLLVCLAFFLIGLNGLQSPQLLYFDEQWYIPAAVRLLNSNEVINREHPMLAKELMAGFYWLFGGSWISARIGSLVFGTIGLFGFQRAHFILTKSPASTIIFGILILGNCLYLTTSRMAVLDPYMLGFSGAGLAFFARAMSEARNCRRNFAAAGLLMGAALACKWTVAPLCIFMAAATVIKFRSDLQTLITASFAAMVPAVSVYVLTFTPLLFADPFPLTLADFFPFQRAMAFHLSTFVGNHPYQSYWWQWPLGSGQMWLLDTFWYKTDRIIVLGQNPISSVIALPSVIIGSWLAFADKSWRLTIPIFAFLITIMFWAAGQKPNLFIYHYNLPLVFALSVTAQLLGSAWATKWRLIAIVTLGAYVAGFILFLPLATGRQQGAITEMTSTFYGWSENPDAHAARRVEGNADELRKWATKCSNVPRGPECSSFRRNIATPR